MNFSLSKFKQFYQKNHRKIIFDILQSNEKDEYEFIETWETKIVETEEQCRAKKYDISTKDRYYFTGRFCRFLGSKDKDYGYKIFMDENLGERHIRLLFEIQDLLAPQPHEVKKCNEDSREN